MRVPINLAGATIVSVTTTDIRPDEGHMYLYMDVGALVVALVAAAFPFGRDRIRRNRRAR